MLIFFLIHMGSEQKHTVTVLELELCIQWNLSWKYWQASVPNYYT